jgi:hypothetical protein
MMNVRFTTPLSAPTQIDPAGPGGVSLVSNAPAALYPTDVLAKGAAAFSGQRPLAVATPAGVISTDKNSLVQQLDTADFFAGRMAFQCLAEGDVQQANQYMQEATDIRKSVEPSLTPAQQQSLEQIMSLQRDAFQTKENEPEPKQLSTQLERLPDSTLQRIISSQQAVLQSIQNDNLKAQRELSQASADWANLRNSILSGEQVKIA